MTTLAAARDAAISVVDTAWKATGAASEDFPMHYDNVKADKPAELAVSTANPGPYARTTVRILGASQTTQGNKRYTTTGTITVQIFTPSGDGHTLGDALTKIVLDALRQHVGSTDGIWFFDVSPAEVGDNGGYFQTNVNGSLRYTEQV